MLDENDGFKIGQVTIIPLLGNIKELTADAFVQSSGTPTDHRMHFSPWVRSDSKVDTIVDALKKHHPFQLGEVIVSTAGSLPAKYLFSAVVIDWANQRPEGKLIYDDVINSVARKCIAIAASIGIKSIVFQPWGARSGASKAAYITALLVQAIETELKNDAGNLKYVYLISDNKEHYQWFVDRTFLFQVMNSQIEEMRTQISELDISTDVQERLLGTIGNLSQTVYVINEVIGGDKIAVGDINNATGVAIGTQSSAEAQEG